jgi:hypothetical protein
MNVTKLKSKFTNEFVGRHCQKRTTSIALINLEMTKLDFAPLTRIVTIRSDVAMVIDWKDAKLEPILLSPSTFTFTKAAGSNKMFFSVLLSTFEHATPGNRSATQLRCHGKDSISSEKAKAWRHDLGFCAYTCSFDL